MKTSPRAARFTTAIFIVAVCVTGSTRGQNAPVITVAPAAQTAMTGTNPYFNVVANGTSPLTYAWKKDGVAIVGATTSELDLKNLQLSAAGNYSVSVSNASGSASSNPALLTVVVPVAEHPPALPKIAETLFKISDYGARGDGATDNTAAIQKAFDAADAAGGGIVKIPASTQPYLCGPVAMGNNTNLQIDAGATLAMLPYSAKASPANLVLGAYPLTSTRFTDFVTATGKHDIAITGQGAIDGQGQAWWTAFRSTQNMPHRPFLTRFTNCDKLLVMGVTLTNSPMYHIVPVADNVTVVGVTIIAPGTAPNTDGMDPAGQHLLIQNCFVSVGDDNVVMKPDREYCGDVMIADCVFGTGHGVSIGGATSYGLDGMIVKNCTFNGTSNGLRMKADPTGGGLVQNITFSNLTMTNVTYPVVFYSYYRTIGNPADGTTPEVVNQYNASPPMSLDSKTLPTWRNITINNLTATGSRNYNIIWGLPLAEHLISNVIFNNVHVDGPGIAIYNAAGIQFTGNTSFGPVFSDNALAITGQPEGRIVNSGGNVTFDVGVAGASGLNNTKPTYQWQLDGVAINDGLKKDGAVVAGTTTATLSITNAQTAEAGIYTAAVSNALDGYNVLSGNLTPNSLTVTTRSSAATLVVRVAPPSGDVTPGIKKLP